MIYFFLAGLSGILFSSLLIFFRQHFFTTLETTIALSNAVLSDEDEFIKQKKLIITLKLMLASLGIALGLIVLIIVATLVPIILYSLFYKVDFVNLDLSSLGFILSLSLGSIIPFLFKRKKSVEDYSEVSILFHKLILNNYFLSKKLFSFDKYFKKDKNIESKNEFLIISGLARSGTTSLTDQLFKAGLFSSLDYSNMPLLLAPNLWRKMYNPKKVTLKERKHGDKMLFGLNTIEALEEYFFKVFLNDSFISDVFLNEHEISEKIYKSYIKYQSLIRRDNASTYLSKNNNIILRYKSLRKFNNAFKIVFLFRTPEEHAFSLLNQHKRFSEFQNENEFMQTYLDWLGHHEFGNHQKIFNFNNECLEISYDKNTLNYWLKVWLNYYTNLIHMSDNNFMLIEYEDYLKMPDKVLQFIENEMKMTFDLSNIEPFENKKVIDTSNCDIQLLDETHIIYNILKERKIRF